MAKTPEDIIREDIRALKSYHVPGSAGMVKLDAMENPYRLPADLRGNLSRLVEAAALNRYPDAGARELKDEERERYVSRSLTVYPWWEQYHRRAAPRQIPVIMLEPR